MKHFVSAEIDLGIPFVPPHFLPESRLAVKSKVLTSDVFLLAIPKKSNEKQEATRKLGEPKSEFLKSAPIRISRKFYYG